MKKTIMGFILGIVFTLALGVGATMLYKASDIEFSPENENWEATNVEEAIEDLYDKVENEYIPSETLVGYQWGYEYTGGYESFIAPVNGIYTIELWGASGANYSSTYTGGKGAYTSGDIYLSQGERIYLYVGSQGSGSTGGYNGGGSASLDSNSYNRAGGGSTDVRTVAGTWNDAESLKSRIMVAAGGGGAGNSKSGGAGGGIDGIAGSASGGTSLIGVPGTGKSSGFGYGADGYNLASGGGSGWYGGGQATYCYACSGGGGSSYVSGFDGCNGINSDGTHRGYSLSYTGKYFTNIQIIDGSGYTWNNNHQSKQTGFPSHDKKSTINGNSGNGYALITIKQVNNLDIDTEADLKKFTNAYIEYSGKVQTYIVPYDGDYEIELWGTSGANYSSTYIGGKGGYTKGNIHLTKGTNLYFYVGSQGSGSTGGYNGGGSASLDSTNSNRAGGGSTDVRITSGAWNDSTSLRSRIMVAGSGGGAGKSNKGGNAGGLIGYSGSASGGSQTSGVSGTGKSSGFGYGADGYNLASGGGSGWYGGGQVTYCYACSGGGGSSYISGHAGSIGVSSSGTANASSYSIIEDSISNTGYKFSDTLIIDGAGYTWTTEKSSSVTGNPNIYNTGTETGHSGNGYAKITLLKID